MSNDSNSPEPDLEDTNRFLRDILGDSSAVDSVSPSGELFRAISRFNRRTARLSRELERTAEQAHAARQRAEQLRRTMSSNNFRERARRQRARIATRAAEHLPPSTPFPLPPHANNNAANAAPIYRPRAPQGPSVSSRPRMTMSDRVLEVHRSLTEGRRSGPSSAATLANLAEMHQAGQQLQQAISQSRALLDNPMPRLVTPNVASREYAGEAETNRSFKRRRLDAPPPQPKTVPVDYGYYGQVEPGKLNMEIEFCDGGTYSEGSAGEIAMYGAANVLKNDASVYSTKSSRCNLVLKHEGGRPFCLKELIIKAPPRGYTAPVQEGMVFISMTSDDLLSRTAQYQIQYLPSSPNHTSDTAAPRPPVISVHHNDDGSTTTTRQSPQMMYTDGTPYYLRSAQIPTDFTDPACSPPFRVTTSCSSDTESDTDSSSLDEFHAPRDAHGARHQRRPERERMGNALAGYEGRSEDSEDEEPPSPVELEWTDEVPPRISHSRSRSRTARQSQPAVISVALESAIDAADEATQEAVKVVGSASSASASASTGGAGGEGLMAPHARFFIERDKNRCRVVFEPEVSGRFVLLKMWSPKLRGEGNIDIQSVVVKGWCGPRWFPKTTMR